MSVVDNLPKHILHDIREHLGVDDPIDTSKDYLIEQMDASDLFDRWCVWNGFLGWSGTIRNALDSIRKATEE